MKNPQENLAILNSWSRNVTTSTRETTTRAWIYEVRMAQFVLKIEKLSHIMGPRGSQTYGLRPRLWLLPLTVKATTPLRPSYYCTSDSLWKIWLVESIQSIHNSLWTWHDKCNICCRYCIYHIKFNVCLVTKPLEEFSSETKWLTRNKMAERFACFWEWIMWKIV